MASLIVRAKTIVTCDTEAPQGGIDFETLGRVNDSVLVVENGRIAAIGPDDSSIALRTAATEFIPRGDEETGSTEIQEIDARDCVIVPGMVDAHSHPLYAGDRERDFAARLHGQPPPLGMRHTIECTRQALLEPQRFYAETIAPRLRMMLAHGTTLLETKTGYALHKPGETLLLDIIAQHRDDSDVPRLVATFLGAHALPPEFTDEAPFVDYLIDQVIPVAAAHGAVYADAFCESGFFSVEQTRRYLEAARRHGMRLRVHCDEMAFAGAAAMATQLKVDAVDHCNYIEGGDVERLAALGIVMVACPATIAFLDLQRRAPVREMLDAGGSVAVASDYNPGTSPCFNLQTVAYYGRRLFGLSAAEALCAVTRSAARSLRSAAGRIRVGERADFVALQIGSPEEFGWQFGGNLVTLVVKAGILCSA